MDGRLRRMFGQRDAAVLPKRPKVLPVPGPRDGPLDAGPFLLGDGGGDKTGDS